MSLRPNLLLKEHTKISSKIYSCYHYSSQERPIRYSKIKASHFFKKSMKTLSSLLIIFFLSLSFLAGLSLQVIWINLIGRNLNYLTCFSASNPQWGNMKDQWTLSHISRIIYTPHKLQKIISLGSHTTWKYQ